MTTQTDRAGEGWRIAFKEPAVEPAELERWHRLRTQLIETAERFGWSKTEVSKRSSIPAATLWAWFDGSYNGVIANQTDRVAKFLDSVAELSAAAARVPVPPAFLMTPTASKVIDALLYAQMMPEMVVVVLGSGVGKSTAVEYYCQTRPNATLVTLRPTTASLHNMLRELCAVFDVSERDPAKLDRALGGKLKRNGRNTLLVLDEAQNLTDQAVNQLRSYLDTYGVGIALLGNEELYGRFGGGQAKPAYAQINRRIGLRLRQLQSTPEDIEMVLDAWGIEDPEVLKLARAVARKPGAVGQMTKTLQLAGMYAAGEARGINAQDMRIAISNRGLEDH